MGDVTDDGLVDVVASSGYSCGCALSVMAQQANGALAGTVEIPATDGMSGSEKGIDLGDLNGDDKLDAAIAYWTGIDIFYQSGGALTAPVHLDTPVNAQQVEIGDVSGDDLNDIVVAASGTGLSLLTNDGIGGFSETAIPGDWANEIDLGDVTGDGKVDLVTRAFQAIYVYPNTGSSFGSSLQYQSSSTVNAISIGDVTGDGLNDVVAGVGGNSDSKMNVFRQTIAGALAPRVVYESEDIPDSAEVTDLNVDGRGDVVIGHGTFESFGVYLQKADGTFSAERLYALPYSNIGPKGIAVGDYNDDGRTDVVFARDGLVSFHRQAARLTLTAPRKIPYRHDATWSVHLGNHATTSNKIVRVYKVHGSTQTLVKSGSVNASGNLTGHVNDLRRNTTLRAEWDGDARSAATFTERTINVAVITTIRLLDYYAVSGRYRLYHLGDEARAVATVLPNHSGKWVEFTLQRFASGRWRHVDYLSTRLKNDGTATVFVHGLRRSTPYRLKVLFGGDNDHAGDVSPWAYLRAT